MRGERRVYSGPVVPPTIQFLPFMTYQWYTIPYSKWRWCESQIWANGPLNTNKQIPTSIKLWHIWAYTTQKFTIVVFGSLTAFSKILSIANFRSSSVVIWRSVICFLICWFHFGVSLLWTVRIRLRIERIFASKTSSELVVIWLVPMDVFFVEMGVPALGLGMACPALTSPNGNSTVYDGTQQTNNQHMRALEEEKADNFNNRQ